MQRREHILPTRTKLDLRMFWSALLHVGLGLLLLVVLMPLFWMIVTALKQPGQALKLQFLPQTTMNTLPSTLRWGEGVVPVVFELQEPAGRVFASVTVAGDFNGWDKTKTPLYKEEENWRVTLYDLTPGRYEYKFVVNGEEWMADPDNPEKNAQGNSLIAVTEHGAQNRPLADATKFEDGKIKFAVRNPHAQ
ncbi:MAG: glycogen-binding domain-containing protein, partial [bacterium]